MLDLVTALLLGALIVLSSMDGLYLHLWKFRLQERPESRREHVLHSLRAWLFLPFLLLLAWQPAGGLKLVLLGLVGLDLLIGLGDVLEEHFSRKSLGGLSRGEYFLHIVLVMLHSTLLSLLLVVLHLQELAPGLLPVQGWTAWLAGQTIPGTVAVALLHVWLIARPDGISRLEQLCFNCRSMRKAT